MIATNTDREHDGFVDVRIIVPAGQSIDLDRAVAEVLKTTRQTGIISSPYVRLDHRTPPVVSGTRPTPVNPSSKEPAREHRQQGTSLSRRL